MRRRTLTQLTAATLAGALLMLWSDNAVNAASNALTQSRLKTMNIAQTVNGLTVRLRAVRLEGDQVRVNVCYPMPNPDSNDYMLRNVSLVVDGRIIANQGGWLDEWLYADGSRIPASAVKSEAGAAMFNAKGQPKDRCDWLTFDVRRAGMVERATLVAEGLGMPTVPQGFTCKKVDQLLADQRIPILVQCREAAHAAVTVEVTQQPPTMTREQATRTVHELITGYRPGPWRFDLSLS